MRSLLARITKREPRRTDADWDQRTYPCRRWFCFRRSPAYLSFERRGKSWCWRHNPDRLLAKLPLPEEAD